MKQNKPPKPQNGMLYFIRDFGYMRNNLQSVGNLRDKNTFLPCTSLDLYRALS